MCADVAPASTALPSILEVVPSSGLEVADEQRIYESLLGGELFGGLRKLVITRDTPRLQSLLTERLPLHDLLDVYAPSLATVGDDLGEPFDVNESMPTHALRAAAAVGLALIDPGQRAAAVDAAARWYRVAASSAAPSESVVQDPRIRQGAVGLIVADVVDVDGSDSAIPLLAATALALDDEGTIGHRAVEVSVSVVFDAFGAGRVASLQLATCPALPPLLAPDPRWMVLFGGDARFKSALDAAWTTAADPFDCGVLWSIRSGGAAIETVEQESLGAALAVGLRELHRRRRLRRMISPYRLNDRTVIVGALGPGGKLRSVTGYEKKLEAVRRHPGWVDGSRVVVPSVDAEVARRHGMELDIVAVPNVDSAAKAARRRDRASLLRLSAIALVLAAMIGVSLAAVAQNAWSGRSTAERNRRNAELRALAARLATMASDQVQGDANGKGLLLAMISDDVARMAGEHTETLAAVVRDQSTLLRILRPKQGAFEKSAFAADGTVALLATNAGEARLVDVVTGDSRWSVGYPPGVQLAPTQRDITAVALESSARLAAVASSTRTIEILRPTAQGSFTRLAELEVSRDANPSGLRRERNVASILAFSPSGTGLVAFGPTVGLLGYDIIAGDREARFRCGFSDEVRAIMPLNETTVVVLTPSNVSSVDLATCAASPLRSFDAGTAGASVGVDGDGRVVAGATRGNELLAGPIDGELATVASSGPYSRVAIGQIDGAMTITASSGVGTFGWALDTGRQRFGLRASGTVLLARDRLLWLHDGVAEVHAPEGNAAQIDKIDIGANVMAFAGQDLAVASLGNWIAVFPKWSAGAPARPALELRGPPGTTVSALKGSPDGQWLAAIFSGNGPPSVMVWHSDSDRGQAIELQAAATSIAFAGDSLLVGDRAGNVRSFHHDKTAWKERTAIMVAGWAGALAVAQDGDTALVVVMGGVNENASVALVEVPTLQVRTTRALTSPAIPPVATGLSSGGFLIAHGAGSMIFLSRDLAIEGSLDADLDYVRDVVEVTRTGQAIVVGRGRATTVDLTSHSLVDSPTWASAGTFGAAATSADGRFLATAPLLAWPVTMWSLDAQDIRARVCNAVGGDLSRQEWQELIGDAVSYRRVCADKIHERFSQSPRQWQVASADAEMAHNLVTTKVSGVCTGDASAALHLEHSSDGSARVCEGARPLADVVVSLPRLNWRPDMSTVRVVPASSLTDTKPPAPGWYVFARGEDSDGDSSTIVNLVVGDEVLWADGLPGTPELAIISVPYIDGTRYVAAYSTSEKGSATIIFPTAGPGTEPNTIDSWAMPGRIAGEIAA